MSRSIILSNGELCVALDTHGLVRDLYYPHVGQENHVRGHYIHRIGVWIDGVMSWLSDDAQWEVRVECEEESLSSRIMARHTRLQVELSFNDIVYNERPVFLRHIVVTNKSEKSRTIKLYVAHQFEIYKSHGGDTAFFDPATHAIIHYKGHRVFLIGATLDGAAFGDFATGRTGFNNQEGTHRDADDGALSQNPIEHGPVDSVMGLYAEYAPGQSRTIEYWIACAESIAEARTLNTLIVNKTPAHLRETTNNYWRAWVRAYEWDFCDLSPDHIALFKRSLMYARATVDVDGGSIASVDSDMLQYGYDTYAYVWPRDSAYTAIALDRAGDSSVARHFFEFCRDVISDEGYYLHKFLPDKSFGSSWHPWIHDGVPQLPIQEDETALVVYALREYYHKNRDLEFLESVYAHLVEKSAEFMCEYRDTETKLPLPSYDLWERKRGTSTFTSCAVFGALMAAAELSTILGKEKHALRYTAVAQEIRTAIMTHLWDDKRQVFINMLNRDASGNIVHDMTLDISSVYGVFAFGVLPHDDPRLARAWDTTVRVLSEGVASGGIARFENDDYFRVPGPSTGNPWFITTLWYGEYLIAQAQSSADLNRVREMFSWVVRHALPSGVLSEQLHPQTGEQICAAPLTWAHGEYLMAVMKYLDRVKEIGSKK
jgi:GH15 family glucan-1,4-alpha-glucosidase